ncbi:MAG: hypothetical protein V3U43_09655, partial [Pseudomonadales bacterium]
MSKIKSRALAGIPLPSQGAKAKDGKVPRRYRDELTTLIGDYRGSWEGDDPDAGQYGISHDELGEIIARLDLDAANRLQLQFFELADDDQAEPPQVGKPIDLLGRACNSRVGPLLEIDVDKMKLEGSDRFIRLSAIFALDTGRCRARVETSGNPSLRLELLEDPAGNRYALLLSVLRTITVKNQLYAKTAEGWVKVAARVTEGGTLYNPKLEYCYEDFDGKEFCFERTKEKRDLFLPVPLPGHAGVFYGWHTA